MILARTLSLTLLLWCYAYNILHGTCKTEHKGADVVSTAEDKKQNITVFIHGSSGSVWSFLSMFNLLQDKPQGTLYQKLQQLLRENGKFVYSNRLLGLSHQPSAEGLIKIGDGKKLSDYDDPVTRALTAIYRQVDVTAGNAEQETFYAFGWNGLLSQTERRKEAVRFYRELGTLVKHYQEAGITPRVRIVSHSHGGNIALNLVAVHEALVGSTSIFSPKASVQEVHTIFNNTASSYEYRKPEAWDMVIDELVMYATPIQQETEGFAFSPVIKRIVNIYSDNDVVQSADFISTFSRKSRRRIATKFYPGVADDKVIQMRICVNPAPAGTKKNKINVKALLRGGKIISKDPYDPSHSDFWCVGWGREDTALGSLPIVVFTPLLRNVVDRLQPVCQDIVCSIVDDKQQGAEFIFTDAQTDTFLTREYVSMPFIKKQRRILRRMKPKLFSFTFSFGAE